MFSFICFCIGGLGWLILITIIISLTGLQKKIFNAAGKSGGLIVTKELNIPFIGKATINSIAGEEILLKIKRKK